MELRRVLFRSKKTLLESAEPTVLTNAFTGKQARSIRTPFTEQLQGYPIPDYPIQHFLTQKLRALAAQKGRADLMSLWAGQGYPLCLPLSASQLIEQIASEI